MKLTGWMIAAVLLLCPVAWSQATRPGDDAEAGPTGYAVERARLVNQRDEIVSVLENGMTVIVKRVPSPVLAVRGYIYTGGVYEGRWLGGGLSHLLEHLVAGGSTEKRTEGENREILQRLGNNSNAYTTLDHTAYYINTTPEHLDDAADLLLGWLLGARITPEEYAREYEVVQRELEKGKGEPRRQFYYLSQKNRYRVNPARVPVIGYQEVIQGLSRDDVYEYYRLAYQPQNIVMSLAGDVDPEAMLAAVQKQVKDAPPGREFLRELPPEPAVTGPRVMVATFPKLGQALLKLAFPTITLDHPDLYALDLLSLVLSEGESSILTEEIRDKRRLVSGIDSGSYTPHFVDGSFEISMRLSPDKIGEATEAVLAVIRDIQENGVSPERLERAKTQARVSRVRRLQTSESIASSLATDYLSTGDPHFSDRYVERMQTVTPEQVQAMAKKYLDERFLLTTAMLPSEYVGAEGLPGAEELLRGGAEAMREAPAEQGAQVTRVELPNNAILLHKRITTAPLVEVRMFSLGGLTVEDEKTNGIGSLTMRMLPRGTTSRSAMEIAEFFDSIGGDLGTGGGNNSWYWNMTTLKEDFEKAFEVYADVVNHPVFDDAELDAMKQRVLAAIESQDADWTAQAMRYFKQRYFGPTNSPYQFLTIGSKETVSGFTSEALRDWYSSKVLKGRRVIAVFGDVELETAQALVERHFGGGEKLATDIPVNAAPPATPAESDKPVVRVERVEVQQTEQPLAGVVIGFRSDSVVGDESNYALSVIDTMTSGWGFPTGYLHETLRGRGLVYVVHAVNQPGQGQALPGVFLVYAGCDPTRVNEVVDLILENIARTQGTDEDMQLDWFDRSRQLITISDAMDNETPSQQATTAALDELFGLGYDHHNKFADKIQQIGISDVRKMANRRLWQAVVTVSTPRPDAVKIETGDRIYDSFPPVDLTPQGVQHDTAAN